MYWVLTHVSGRHFTAVETVVKHFFGGVVKCIFFKESACKLFFLLYSARVLAVGAVVSRGYT